MWKKINDWAEKHEHTIDIVFNVVFVVCILVCLWAMIHREPPNIETTMPQQQAETPVGVQQASENAHVKLDYGQATQVSEIIKEIRVTEKEPMVVIQTTGSEAKDISENVVKQEKADFAIVTDKDNSEKTVELDKLDKNTTVNLNQYNIKAYKNHINIIEYYPAEKTVGYTHQWKISKSGKYIGVGVDYDTDDERVMAKVTYSW